MASHPDLGVWPQKVARIYRVPITLPQMDAIGANPLGKAHVVIDDESHISLPAKSKKRLSQPSRFMLINAFDTKLERRHRTGIERFSQAGGEVATGFER